MRGGVVYELEAVIKHEGAEYGICWPRFSMPVAVLELEKNGNSHYNSKRIIIGGIRDEIINLYRSQTFQQPQQASM